MVKVDCDVVKKSSDLEIVYNQLLEIAEEKEINERVERIKRIVQRRMPNLRRQVERNELKKIVEQKVKDQNKKELSRSKVTAKINNVWYLVSKKYDALSDGDKKIDYLLLEVEKILKKTSKFPGFKRRSTHDEEIAITEKLVELNVLLNTQNDLLQNQYKEINDEIGDLKSSNFTEHENSNQLGTKAEEFSKYLVEKDLLLAEKYSKMEVSFTDIEDIRREAEELRKKHAATENDGRFNDLLIMNEDDALDFAENEKKNEKKKEGTISDQLGRITHLKGDAEGMAKIIIELEKKMKRWTSLAHTCTCFYSGWFNKKCKFT
jgi:hypothetical protein